MWTKIDKSEQTEPLKVYHEDKDLFHTIVQIVSDMKDKANGSSENDWSISYKDLKSCNVKMNGDRIVLCVSHMIGSVRVSGVEDQQSLSRHSKETKDLLNKFEKSLKKEFKKRTGKNLRFSGPKVKVDWQLVSPNGLYHFYGTKSADVTTSLEGQSFEQE